MTNKLDIPGYRIESELGRGGMATAYLAVQESLGRRVALKVMSPALAADGGYTERFIREARTIAQIQHLNIVSIYESGVAGFHHYLVLEYIEDGDLKRRLHEHHIPVEGEVLVDGRQVPYIEPAYNRNVVDPFAIVRQVASALDAARAKGFIHRDVKPENILFRADGSVVLTDFGIARAEAGGTQMTGIGMSIGTPHYMSPEQARGHTVDGRADLYSLGVVLYEMLERKVPFEGQESMAIGIKHITEPVPGLMPHHAHWQPIIDGLMAKAPEDRFQTGAELITALDQLAAGRPLGVRQKTVVMSRIEVAGVTSEASSVAVRPLRKGLYWAAAGAAVAGGLGGVLWFIQAPDTFVGGRGASKVVRGGQNNDTENVTRTQKTETQIPGSSVPPRQTTKQAEAAPKNTNELQRRTEGMIAKGEMKSDANKKTPASVAIATAVPSKPKQVEDPAMVARLEQARQILETGDLWVAKAKVEEVSQSGAVAGEAGALLRTINFAINDRRMQGEALRKRAVDAYDERKFSQALEFCQEIKRVYPPGLPGLDVCANAQREKEKLLQSWQEQNRGEIRVEKR